MPVKPHGHWQKHFEPSEVRNPSFSQTGESLGQFSVNQFIKKLLTLKKNQLPTSSILIKLTHANEINHDIHIANTMF